MQVTESEMVVPLKMHMMAIQEQLAVELRVHRISVRQWRARAE